MRVRVRVSGMVVGRLASGVTRKHDGVQRRGVRVRVSMGEG